MSDTDREWEAELDEDFDAPPPGADIFARPSAMGDTGAVERAAEEAEWCMDPACYRDAHDHSRRDGYYSD